MLNNTTVTTGRPDPAERQEPCPAIRGSYTLDSYDAFEIFIQIQAANKAPGTNYNELVTKYVEDQVRAMGQDIDEFYDAVEDELKGGAK